MDKEEELHDSRCGCGMCLSGRSKDEIDKALDEFAEAGTKAWAGVNPRELRGETSEERFEEDRANALELKLAIATECLRWYADFADTTAIEYDCGKRAKQTLEWLEKQ